MANLRTFATGIRSYSLARSPDVYGRVIKLFPQDMQMVFAYGSGVFQQSGSKMSKNMLDFIFVVDDPKSWHAENVERNADHYSAFFRMFPQRIAPYQENKGAGVFFNTLIPFEERLIKYGVVNTNCLISDLKHWDTLYISGRLHKPVNIVIPPSNEDLSVALKMNLKSAFHASLFLLPEQFTEEQLFIKIASLSYSGDFRMIVGEDKGKVKKIVDPNMDHFRALYDNVVQNEKYLCRKQNMFQQSKCDQSSLHHLESLPLHVLNNLSSMCGGDQTGPHFLKTVAKNKDAQKYVAQSIAKVVKDSSIWQSLKNIPTAGFRKTVMYSLSKLKKMVKGMMPIA